MTGIALGSQPAFVNVISLMALLALGRGFLIFRSQMAVFTGHGGMKPQQGELGFVVIEFDSLAPGLLVMALVTLLPLLSFVDIVL